MNTVKVPAADFAVGKLPEVCVRSGLVARNQYRVVATGPSGALVGAVNLHGSVAKRINAWRTSGFVSLAIAVIASALASLYFRIDLSLLLLFVGVGLMILCLRVAKSSGVDARVVDDGNIVELSPCSDGFKLALMLPAGGKCSTEGGCACHSVDARSTCSDEDAAIQQS